MLDTYTSKYITCNKTNHASIRWAIYNTYNEDSDLCLA